MIHTTPPCLLLTHLGLVGATVRLASRHLRVRDTLPTLTDPTGFCLNSTPCKIRALYLSFYPPKERECELFYDTLSSGSEVVAADARGVGSGGHKKKRESDPLSAGCPTSVRG